MAQMREVLKAQIPQLAQQAQLHATESGWQGGSPLYRQRASCGNTFSYSEPDARTAPCFSLHELFKVGEGDNAVHGGIR